MSSDLHMMTGAYAAHALPPDEEAEFERHLRTCDACSQEVRELEATTARLGAALAVPPRDAMKARVLSQIATVRQLPPRGAPAPRRDRWWRQPAGIAAAALFALSLALGGVVVEQRSELARRAEPPHFRLEALEAVEVIGDPGRRVSSAPVRDGGVATVVAAGERAVVLAADLAGVPAGRTYQLWTISADRSTIRSAGVVDARSGSLLRLLRLPAGTGAVAMSIEPAGGSTQPTPDQIVTQVLLT